MVSKDTTKGQYWVWCHRTPPKDSTKDGITGHHQRTVLRMVSQDITRGWYHRTPPKDCTEDGITGHHWRIVLRIVSQDTTKSQYWGWYHRTSPEDGITGHQRTVSVNFTSCLLQSINVINTFTSTFAKEFFLCQYDDDVGFWGCMYPFRDMQCILSSWEKWNWNTWPLEKLKTKGRMAEYSDAQFLSAHRGTVQQNSYIQPNVLTILNDVSRVWTITMRVPSYFQTSCIFFSLRQLKHLLESCFPVPFSLSVTISWTRI